jgi:hypothetical protein
MIHTTLRISPYHSVLRLFITVIVLLSSTLIVADMSSTDSATTTTNESVVPDASSVPLQLLQSQTTTAIATSSFTTSIAPNRMLHPNDRNVNGKVLRSATNEKGNDKDDLIDDKDATAASTTSTTTAHAHVKENDSSSHNSNKSCPVKTISMAFCGNSMLYFNDSPRLLEFMITLAQPSIVGVGGAATESGGGAADGEDTGADAGVSDDTYDRNSNHGNSNVPQQIQVVQDSCLRGGATLSSLYTHGNGMTTKFQTPAAQIQLSQLISTLPKQLFSTNANLICTNDANNSVNDNKPTETTTKPSLDSAHSQSHSHTKSSSSSSSLHYDIGSHTVQKMLQSRTNWDFIILNDHTQGPARLSSRKQTQRTLRTKYIPLILQQQQTKDKSHTKVITIQTPAYQKEKIKDSDDLGNFVHFTDLLAEGTAAYVQTLRDAGLTNAHVAPVGEAYRYIYNTNRTLWNLLYSWDHFHPSPYGTYLQICVLYCIMFQQCLPIDYNEHYWSYSRYMQPIDEEPLPKPTLEEAKELRRVACIVTGIKIDTMKENSKIGTNTKKKSGDDDEDDDDEGDDDDVNEDKG